MSANLDFKDDYLALSKSASVNMNQMMGFGSSFILLID